MKPLLLFGILLLSRTAFSQSLDYLSVRKQNGRVIKNFYSGSTILLQLNDDSYLKGPVSTLRNDSVYVTVYDIRYYRTNWGSSVQDTISTSVVGASVHDIKRVYLNKRKSFFQRDAGPLLKIGGAGYFALNLLNGNFFGDAFTREQKWRKAGFSAGAFGLGYLLDKLFASDGFSKRKDRIVYVDL